MLYITFDSHAPLRMKLLRVATPQTPFPEIGKQGDTVSHVKLQIERQRTAVDEGVPVMERGAVMQYLLAPVHRFISGESRSTRIDEHDFTSIGEYLEVVSALRRELCHGYLSVLVRVVLQQVFAAEHPFVSAFGISGKSRPETVPAVVAAGIEAVRHVRPDLDALHLRQASLGVRLPREQGKRRDDYCDVLSHGQRT